MFREMRRKDKEKTREEAERILHEGEHGTLAVLLDSGYPYSLPVSYVYEDGRIYFHSAVAGQKYEALLRDSRVCFSVVEADKTQPAPGEFTVLYSSAIAFGRASLVEDEAEIRRALHLITGKYDPSVSHDSVDTYVQPQLSRVCVFRVDVEHLSGKGMA